MCNEIYESESQESERKCCTNGHVTDKSGNGRGIVYKNIGYRYVCVMCMNAIKLAARENETTLAIGFLRKRNAATRHSLIQIEFSVFTNYLGKIISSELTVVK